MPSSDVFIMPLDEVSHEICKKKFGDKPKVKMLNNCEIINKIGHFTSLGRSFSEAIFTVKPLIIYQAFKEIKNGTHIFYADADLFFFQNLPLEEFEHADFVVSKHIILRNKEAYAKYGNFNAGLVGFKKTNKGFRILKAWIKMCVEKCSLIPDVDSFADQKYLEILFAKYPTASCIKSFGVNQGMWAISRTSEIRSNRINSDPLICFHFHGLRVDKTFVFTDMSRYSFYTARRDVNRHLYRPYIRAMDLNLEMCDTVIQTLPIAKFRIKRFYDYRLWPKNS
jgi:uncharacterized protein YneR